ncbi:Pimeloyl-ACP methyl ester carboxylesterase [Saccharopolyspora kobensis]|uniref:10-carbomethoxy-13-deoxycarminomycin esterase/esterase n=1 Tax=Saccharopolyspora kobensis TaxID=146035 RepID=A0A1H5TG29_9PSEU|nr:alpha/beta fold hydrolase [Saccharopolyspora kobensis]SEF61812.1 Pimeloyl-ACP methyl ester carboxylesterase [Saccharopolyspora kobensis]SFC46768.1 10-carbomethoxy-13-deoxycarminomycin esterase/esterase [Saccharopolyspora kobensis]
MTERMVASGTARLWSEDHGDPGDPPVLLISGDCQSALFWPDEVVAALVGGGFRVIRYDHRDTGRSTHRDFAANPYTFDDLTADAIAVLDAWDVGAAHVVAFSMGAGLAQLLAVDHPHRMLSQTLICTHALGIDFADNAARALAGEPSLDGLPLPESRVFEALELHAEPAADRSAELDRRVAGWRIMAGDAFDPAEFRRREERVIDHAGTLHQSIAHGYVTEGIATRGADLARITAPTLLVQAPLDPISPPPHGRHLAESIPGAALVEIPGMGHALTGAALDALLPAVLAHLRR